MLFHGLIKVYIRLTSGASAVTVLGQHRATSGPAICLVLPHVWDTSGKSHLGHQRAVILCGMWAECQCIVWARLFLLSGRLVVAELFANNKTALDIIQVNCCQLASDQAV